MEGVVLVETSTCFSVVLARRINETRLAAESGAGEEGQHSMEGDMLVETSTRFSSGAGE
jgi:hypothetical protein